MNVIFGIHAVKSALLHKPANVKTVLVNEKRNDKRLAQLEQLARDNGIQLLKAEKQNLSEVAESDNHQGVVAYLAPPQRQEHVKITQWLKGLSQSRVIVVLDSIGDPRNMGACIRSANVAGVGGVVVSKSRGCSINATVSKTAAGAAESTAIYQSSNLVRDLETLKSKDYWVIGFDPDANESLYSTDLTEKCVLVFGSEDKGLRLQTRHKCDLLAKIPSNGQVDSLNVSVAVGVVTFESLRQSLNLESR